MEDYAVKAGRRGSLGQSLAEMAIMLPFLFVLLVGMVQVVLVARNYLVLLEASREGARLGARGAALFDDAELQTLVEQDLSREGYSTANGLIDIIIVRAEVESGVVSTYTAASMLGSGRPALLAEGTLLTRLDASDPRGRLVAVEIIHDHQSGFLPEPLTLHTYSVMRILR
jgi:Flp pilus assembly protein TadG